MYPTFALITEGVTDQIIIENILIGCYNSYDISQYIRPLQPLRDATDSLDHQFGGWYNVLEYCKSLELEGAFEQNDFVVIQIDTDCCHEKHYEVSKYDGEGREVSNEELYNRIEEKLISIIVENHSEEFLNAYKDRIIFAIAIDEIECWLIPLHHDSRTKCFTNNCIYKLNNLLTRNGKDTINPAKKDPDLYEEISKQYCKSKTIKRLCECNFSLNKFIEELESKMNEMND